MARRVRTIILVVGVGVALFATLPPTGVPAKPSDMLGNALGGGSGHKEPPQSGTSSGTQSGSGGTQSGSGGTQPSPPQSVDRSVTPQPRDPLMAPESSCPGQSASSLPVTAEVRAMICMLSYARVAKGLPALRVSRALQISATHKAYDIKRCHMLSHDACGRGAWYWFRREGFFQRPWIAGEILAIESGERATARGTLRAWLDSGEHRAALLHGCFNRVGVATVPGRVGGFRGMIWAAHLGCHP
jgi:uncharacterized protein YkwD